ncbi:MAG: amino acid permease [Methylobacterium sp.]
MTAIDDRHEGEARLKRAVGFPQVMLFGLGSMLGAGVYGLIGEAAGELGSAIWMAFLVSMVAALLTGLSYASIASRYPRAGGAAYVTQRAYGRPIVSYVVGLAVVCSGLTSIATQSNVVARNFASVTGIDAPLGVLAIGFLVLLAGVLFRGISESLWLNAVCTVVEAFGLLLVIAVGISYWGNANLLEFPTNEDGSALEGSVALLVAQGAVLTFFSFIGFEDMLNVSEEVKNPERTMPMAMIAAMLAATAIYIAIAVTAVSVVPWRELAEAPGPLTLVVERAAPWFPTSVYAGITIFAVANTALVNYVMASRLLYGMSKQGLMPAALGRVHATRHTPYVAIGALLVVVVALSLVGDIAALASSTVLLLLAVFTVVNVALLVLQRRADEPRGAFEIPRFVPLLGALCCAGLIVVRVAEGDWAAPIIAASLVAAIFVLYLVTGAGREGRIDAFLASERGS